jgi:hypothetical protein
MPQELTMELENEGCAKIVHGSHGDYDVEDLFFATVLPEHFYDAIAQACINLGVTNFWSYCKVEDNADVTSGRWYDPDDGLRTAGALIAHFVANPKVPGSTPYRGRLMNELRMLEEALREAKRRGKRFRLFLYS